VSADKQRFRHDGFDLDLTYITDRLIGENFNGSSDAFIYFCNLSHVVVPLTLVSAAMAFPAVGVLLLQ
jgi:hypothetical protein